MKGKCYQCQYEERKHEIGPNKKAYEDALRGNTMSMNPCEKCGKPEIFYTCDMDKAIRDSNNEFSHPEDWD